MPPARRTVWPTVAVYAAIVFALAGGGGLFVRSQRAEMQRRVENELNAIADLKVQQIGDWRRERLGDAQFFSQAAFVPRDVRAFFDHPASASAKDELVRWMTLLKGNNRYSRVSLFDARGELRLMLPEDADPPGGVLHGHVAEVLRNPRIQMTDLHLSDEGDVHLNISFPVFAPPQRPGPESPPATNPAPLLGVIVLELNPRQFLYPLIQKWPMPSRTAETLLVRREGDEVVFLNDLRHSTNPALALRISIHQKALPAARAARGEVGVRDGVDYRGVPVLAAMRAVPDSPWFLVAKVDREEIYAPLRKQVWLAGLLTGALALAGGLGLMAVWRGRETAFLRQDLVRQREAEAALAQERQFLAAVLDNIGEAVVACNAQGALTRFNEAARELHGLPPQPIPPEEWARYYSLFQADGKTPLRKEEVPLFRALQGGRVRGVEMVVAPKGRPPRVLLVSAQPMYDAGGKLLGAVAAMHDITERKQLEAERNKFVLLADSSSEFIGMCDLALHPLYVNPAGIRMVGLPDLAAACRVKVQDYFFPEDQRFMAEEFFPRVLRDGHGEVEIRLRHFQTGAAIWVSYYLFSVRDATGTPVGWGTVSRDITERKRAEAELRRLHEELRLHAAGLEQRVAERTAELERARDRAEAADRIKSAFLATMSHELRTPLNSVIGFTGMLLQGLAGPLNAEQTKQLRMVKESGQHLLALINDVLDISKIEAGEIELRRAPFQLKEAIEKTLRAVAPLAEKKGLALAARVAPEVGEITTDRRRVEQVLLNLLSNAIKFTERGQVTLTAEVARASGARQGSGQDGASVRIAVADTGIGIKAEDLPKLFQPFQQLDSGLTRQHEGTGLGLAICKRLVERLGGAITVESEWGKGSTFTVTLPAGGQGAG